MCAETGLWWVWSLLFFALMILCMLVFGKRGRWLCCSPFEYRNSRGEYIRRLEEEIKRLKGERRHERRPNDQ